ncbi:hypothetical protein PDK45_29400 [Bacillus cereus]|nr:hypothetical protein [Bacillus cereus]
MGDQGVVDGATCCDHAVEERCAKRGEERADIAFRREFAAIDGLSDDWSGAHGLVVEVPPGCLAERCGPETGGENKCGNLAPDAVVEDRGELTTGRE